MNRANKNIIVLTETDSTNNYANRLISEGNTASGTVVLSHYQHQGKGQRGNKWESTSGMNLLASIIVFPDFLPPGKQFSLSKIASLALINWLRQETTGVAIKWPNDIYVGEKKIAGILIETSFQGNHLQSAVVGIGLNLNQSEFSSELPNPVSLKRLTGKNYDLIDTAVQLRKNFMEWYSKMEAGCLAEIDTAYMKNLFRKNEWAMFQKDGHIWEARITGTGESGQLILEERSGNRSEYFFREIEFVI